VLLCLLQSPAGAQEGMLLRPVETTQGQRKCWIPAVLAPRPQALRPAVLVLHSTASSPTQIERLTGFSRWAREEGFLVAYPEGREGRWNDGRSDPYPPSLAQDDVAFLGRCLDLLLADYGADATRLYVVGFDAGGSLALVAGIQLQHRLAGVGACMAGFSASLEALLSKPCSTPVLLVQSENDPCVPYQGGAVRYFGGKSRGQVLSSDSLVQRWSGLQQATDSVPVAGGVREHWGPRLVRIRLASAGHLWPGTEAPVSEELFGPLQRDLPATQILWEFLRARP
jgi:poly(3-hydroxybutyrate) depolymerase